MKPKTLLVFAISILIVSAIFTYRSCRADARYERLKADYLESVRLWELDRLNMSVRLDTLNASIAAKDIIIAQKDAEVARYVDKVSTLTAELTALQNAEPPTTPEIESLPIVVNLRGQVSKLTEMFNLSQETITLQSQEIDALKGKSVLLESVVSEWRGAYDREHTLRVQAEGLFKTLEHRQKLSKFWNKAAIVAVAGAVAYGLLK